MSSYIDVTFQGSERDPSVESTIHRWIARLEAMRIEVHHAGVTIARSRRRTQVNLTLELVDGTTQNSATVHADVYVGVADAFRNVLRAA